MARINKSTVGLRIMGESLVPSEVSSILGCNSTYEHVKGQVIVGKKAGKERVMESGMWQLSATDREPENIDQQVEEILNQLTSDVSTWESLSSKYEIDLFCGLFMEDENEGIEVSPRILKMLGERGIYLDFDIYSP